jgi:hypothetical protein
MHREDTWTSNNGGVRKLKDDCSYTSRGCVFDGAGNSNRDEAVLLNRIHA